MLREGQIQSELFKKKKTCSQLWSYSALNSSVFTLTGMLSTSVSMPAEKWTLNILESNVVHKHKPCVIVVLCCVNTLFITGLKDDF